jgi:mannosyltransferase OCH1-like enzyme
MIKNKQISMKYTIMSDKIPKIIHYCWFGNNDKPAIVLKCIESWKKYLPDFEIIEWNEHSIISIKNQYMNDALKEKKWAFVSDYIRLYALYNYGGIYLDTDEEILKPLNEFLNLDLCLGKEEYQGRKRYVGMSFIAAKKDNNIIKEFLDEYENISFYNENGTINYLANTERFHNLLISRYNLPNKVNTKNITKLTDNSVIFPSNYFCKYKKGVSYAFHHYEACSWLPHLKEYCKKYIFKNFYIKVYTIRQQCFKEEIKNIKNELIILGYPRYHKNTIIITIAKELINDTKN